MEVDKFSTKMEVLESIVKTPIYMLEGYTHDRLVYVSTEEGIVSLWSLNLRSKARNMLTREPIHTVAKPTSKSKLVIFTRDVSGGRELQKIYSVDVTSCEEKLAVDIEPLRIFGLIFDGEKISYAGATRDKISLYLASEEGSYEEVVELNAVAWPTDISKKYVVGCGLMKGNPKSMELFIYHLSSGDFEIYTPREGSVNKRPKVWGDKLLFESNFEREQRLYIYDVGSKELYKAEVEFRDYEEYKPVEHLDYGWTEEGKIWTIAKKNGRSKAFINGEKLPSPEGFISSLVIVGGKTYYTHSTLTTPPKIYSSELRGSYEVVLDNELPREVRDRIGERYFVTYNSKDGLEIPMYVVESRAAKKPGPTVLYVHGGPWDEVLDGWSVLIAGIVASGYHVLAPNFRGSTGYGEDFRLKDVGDPGGGDLEDVVEARNWGVENKLTSSIAILGYSYGGYMTYMALGKYPKLWDAGVAGAGIVDWVEMYGLSDAIFKKFIEALFNGYNEELMEERSPITYVSNVEKPICIIHPRNDSRAPLKPIFNYVAKLLEEGKEFEMHVIREMGHVITSTRDVVKILLPAIIFLDEKIGKDAG